MDELEARLAALEGLLLERLSLDPPPVLKALKAQVMLWPDKVQRAQAVGIVEDAQQRFDEFTAGTVIKPEE